MPILVGRKGDNENSKTFYEVAGIMKGGKWYG